MASYPWPGNVRELSNVVERGCILTKTDVITADLLMLPKNANLVPGASSSCTYSTGEETLTLAQAEENAIRNAIQKVDGNKNEAARLLGVHRTTLYKKLEEYKIES